MPIADSDENNEGWRLFQWGAAALNVEIHMQHIHLHLPNGFAPGRVEPRSSQNNISRMSNTSYAAGTFKTASTGMHVSQTKRIKAKKRDNYVWAETLGAKCSIKI